MSDRKRDAVARELDTLLGPEFVSFISGHAYIEGHRVVALANAVFGFDGWSSQIREMTVDYSEEVNSRYSVGISCTMRVTLTKGVFHEDVGYGNGVNMPSRYLAYDKARKEAATDALKRTLRLFGETMGNCLYNKDYVEVVRRIRANKPTFDPSDMRRTLKRIKSSAVVNDFDKSLNVPKKQDKGPHLPAVSEPGVSRKSVQAQARQTALHNEPHTLQSEQAPQVPQLLENSEVKLPVRLEKHDGQLQASTNAQIEVPVLDSEDDREELHVMSVTQGEEQEVPQLSPVDAVFVTADLAALVDNPDVPMPIPAEAIFNPLKPNEINSSNSKVPQDRSMPIRKSQHK